MRFEDKNKERHAYLVTETTIDLVTLGEGERSGIDACSMHGIEDEARPVESRTTSK